MIRHSFPTTLIFNLFFSSVVEHVSKRLPNHRNMCATPVTGANRTALSQLLLCPVVACHRMGCLPGCLGQITSVEENHTPWMNFLLPAVEATTVTPESDPQAPPKCVHPASLTLMAESTHERTFDWRKLL